MSLAHIRTALETQLATALTIDLAHENENYAPVAGRPYAAAYLLPAQPNNIEMGPGYTEQGLLQCSLFYPLNAGAGDAQAQAEAIRSAFPFASSFTASGTVVNIIATPEIAPARAEDDRFMVPVKIKWSARIGS